MTVLYATVDETLNVMSSGISSTTVSRVQVLSNLRIVSRRVDRMFVSNRPIFAPVLETRRFAVRGDRMNSWDNLFRFDGSLLSLTSVVVGSDTLVNGTQVEAYSEDGMTPYTHLHLLDYGLSWSNFCSTTNSTPSRIAITGYWGIHHDYANAFQSVDVLVTPFITTSTQATFAVASAAGADTFGITPRLSEGQIIRIENELMDQTGLSTNTITVRRGVNGTTAAAHASALAVETFIVEEPVRRAVARQAGLLFARKGAYTTVEVQGMGTEIRYPVDLLQELRGALAGYAYEH